VEAHAGDLRSEVKGRDEWVDTVKRDWKEAELTERQRAICEYAEKLTRAPASVTEADIRSLRGAGFDDPGIVNLAHVVGFFAYANRVVDGLGCDLEPGMKKRRKAAL